MKNLEIFFTINEGSPSGRRYQMINKKLSEADETQCNQSVQPGSKAHVQKIKVRLKMKESEIFYDNPGKRNSKSRYASSSGLLIFYIKHR